jgi:hypothetical protein
VSLIWNFNDTLLQKGERLTSPICGKAALCHVDRLERAVGAKDRRSLQRRGTCFSLSRQKQSSPDPQSGRRERGPSTQFRFLRAEFVGAQPEFEENDLAELRLITIQTLSEFF